MSGTNDRIGKCVIGGRENEVVAQPEQRAQAKSGR